MTVDRLAESQSDTEIVSEFECQKVYFDRTIFRRLEQYFSCCPNELYTIIHGTPSVSGPEDISLNAGVKGRNSRVENSVLK